MRPLPPRQRTADSSGANGDVLEHDPVHGPHPELGKGQSGTRGLSEKVYLNRRSRYESKRNANIKDMYLKSMLVLLQECYGKSNQVKRYYESESAINIEPLLEIMAAMDTSPEVLYHMCLKALWDEHKLAGTAYYPPTREHCVSESEKRDTFDKVFEM